MNCLAIGDVILPTKYFDLALEKDPLFTSYSSMGWKEDLDRAASRNMIRKIETQGYRAFEAEEAYLKAAETAEVLFIHFFPVSETLMDRAKNLKYIISARGGVENIDVAAAKKRGITILHCPSHNAVAVAEYTIGLMIAETRNIARANIALRSGVWRERYPNSAAIPELSDATIGIVGFGTIGQIVARYASVFGSTIVVHDPFVPDETIRAMGYTPMEKNALLEASDIVTLHGRIPADAPPVIGAEEFKRMKKTACLINTARAVLVDMGALETALRTGEIMGAAIDVYPAEPLPADSPLLDLDNITLTNHRGGDTLNAYAKAPVLLMGQFRELLETGKTRFMIR
jgi:D-3-phosphoglycerate dehydrogenase